MNSGKKKWRIQKDGPPLLSPTGHTNHDGPRKATGLPGLSSGRLYPPSHWSEPEASLSLGNSEAGAQSQ